MTRNIKTREGYEYWDKLCAIPRYGFIHSPDNSRILKVEGLGNWIGQHEAQQVVDAAQDEINALRAQIAQLDAEIEEWSGTAVQNGMEVDRLREQLAQQNTCEPVHFRALLREDQRPSMIHDKHVVGFKSRKLAESWVAEQNDFHGWNYSIEALYTHPEPVQQHPDDAAVDAFAAAMKEKLARARDKGRHGWQACSARQLSAMLYDHLYKADPVDVANFSMMLHQNGQYIELPYEARRSHAPVQQQEPGGVYQQAIADARTVFAGNEGKPSDVLEYIEALIQHPNPKPATADAALVEVRDPVQVTETNDQIAKVMLLQGKPEQQQEAARYAGIPAPSKQDGWIPVSERLPIPAKHARVLIFTEGHDYMGVQVFDVKAALLYESFWDYPEDRPEPYSTATHWMPLPTAPATTVAVMP